MKKIIGFRVFNTEESFVKWQMDEDRVVFQVSPFMFDLKGGMSEVDNNSQGKDNVDVNMKPSVGVFVTYEYSMPQ